jgi:3-isopropylmalate/(R)-2-methylmalate dehydratase small subunit
MAMEPISSHTGRAIPLRRSDVDTDQIIPSDCCRRLTKTGYEAALFRRWRQQPDFVFNDAERQGATVLVAGPNFGTGSSREHAVWALRDWGVRAVVAPSFGDIFQRNALKNGLLVALLPEEAVDTLLDLADADPAFEVTVDLAALEVRADRSRWSFEIDQRARWLLVNGYDDIDVTLTKDDAISAYELRRQHWLPAPSAGAHPVAEPVPAAVF